MHHPVFLKFAYNQFIPIERPESYDLDREIASDADPEFPYCDGYVMYTDVGGGDAAAAAGIYPYLHQLRGSYWIIANIDGVIYWVYSEHAFDFYGVWCHHVLQLPQVIDMMDDEYDGEEGEGG